MAAQLRLGTAAHGSRMTGHEQPCCLSHLRTSVWRERGRPPSDVTAPSTSSAVMYRSSKISSRSRVCT